MLIRQAGLADAGQACEVLRRSISELCAADHRHDEAVLARWLASKTPENVRRWIQDAGNTVLVAEHDGSVAAVGAVKTDGEITLNYVSPEHRFQGISKAMLAALEAVSRGCGHTISTLNSTRTAHRFYLAAAYTDTGTPIVMFGTTSYPMTKRL
jgi:GNAT superfamily N-acetyltransferase